FRRLRVGFAGLDPMRQARPAAFVFLEMLAIALVVGPHVGAVTGFADRHEPAGTGPVVVHDALLSPALAADLLHQNGIESISSSRNGSASVARAGRSRAGAPPRVPPEPPPASGFQVSTAAYHLPPLDS